MELIESVITIREEEITYHVGTIAIAFVNSGKSAVKHTNRYVKNTGIMVIVETAIVSYYIKNCANNTSHSDIAPMTSAGIHIHLSAGKPIQYLYQMGYPRVTTGTETAHMVTRTNTLMIKEVIHMEINHITIKITITLAEIVEVIHKIAKMCTTNFQAQIIAIVPRAVANHIRMLNIIKTWRTMGIGSFFAGTGQRPWRRNC